MSAVDRMVSEPPSSRQRAAPRNCPGRLKRCYRDTAGQGPAVCGCGQVVGAAQPGERVEHDDHAAAELREPLGALDGELGGLDVIAWGLVEGSGDDLAAPCATPLSAS